jgi:hypothetical protein
VTGESQLPVLLPRCGRTRRLRESSGDGDETGTEQRRRGAMAATSRGMASIDDDAPSLPGRTVRGVVFVFIMGELPSPPAASAVSKRSLRSSLWLNGFCVSMVALWVPHSLSGATTTAVLSQLRLVVVGEGLPPSKLRLLARPRHRLSPLKSLIVSCWILT